MQCKYLPGLLAAEVSHHIFIQYFLDQCWFFFFFGFSGNWYFFKPTFGEFYWSRDRLLQRWPFLSCFFTSAFWYPKCSAHLRPHSSNVNKYVCRMDSGIWDAQFLDQSIWAYSFIKLGHDRGKHNTCVLHARCFTLLQVVAICCPRRSWMRVPFNVDQ